MDADVTAPNPITISFRARQIVQRREPAVRFSPRSRLSSEYSGSYPSPCRDCGTPTAWSAADLTHVVYLCLACARSRRIDPAPTNRLELAARLDWHRIEMLDQLRTVMALLEGTEFEQESRIWANLITCAIDAPGLGGVPAHTMSSTIARIREPFIHGGGNW